MEAANLDPRSAAGPAPSARQAISTALVAVAAAMWASDAYFRPALTRQLSAGQIVFVEDLLIALCLLPVLLLNWKLLRDLSGRHWLALVVIGVGPQAVATLLFTQSIGYAFSNPRALDLDVLHEVYLLYLAQPIFGLLLARLVLGERRSRSFWPLALPALAGVYLVVFADSPAAPLQIGHVQLQAALLVLGAVALWAAGTVLGRYAMQRIGFPLMTAMRFLIALPVLTVLLLTSRGGAAFSGFALGQLPYILGIVLIPGLLAMLLYYRGLSGTHASLATIAELAYPCTLFLVFSLPAPVGQGAPLRPIEVAGAVLLVAAVTVLNLANLRNPLVAAPAPAGR